MMPPVKSSSTYDIVIVGNGVIGLSLAYQLKKQDKALRVAIVGPSNRPGSASMAAGAMINVWSELTHGQFDYPALSERAEMAIAALPLWDALCGELREYSETAPNVTWGTYLINNACGSPHELATVDYILEQCANRGIKHRIVNPNSIEWLKPETKGQISRAVWLPDGRLNPALLLDAYETAVRTLNVQVLDDVATNLSYDATGESTTVATKGGLQLTAKHLVLANGSHAQSLIDPLPELSNEIPRLVWGAGSAIRLTLPDWVKKYGGIDRSIMDIDQVVRTVDRGGACGLHLVPYGNGEYYCGASSGVWFDPEPFPRVHAVHVLLQTLVEQVHKAFFFAGMELIGPGFRPTTIDTFPLLGESHFRGIWFANGTKRDGLTCSPIISRELAKAILGGPCELPKRFTPARKLISYKTKPKAISDSIYAELGGETQHGLYLPPYAVAPYLETKMARLEKIYCKREIGDFGIHPEVVHLYENDDFFAAINHPRESAV